MNTPKQKNKAFSLTELLVVFSILALLIALLMPAFRRFKESANSAVCMSNMRQIGVAMIAYNDEFNVNVPFITYRNGDNTSWYYWSDYLAAYMKPGVPIKTWARTEHDSVFTCPSWPLYMTTTHSLKDVAFSYTYNKPLLTNNGFYISSADPAIWTPPTVMPNGDWEFRPYWFRRPCSPSEFILMAETGPYDSWRDSATSYATYPYNTGTPTTDGIERGNISFHHGGSRNWRYSSYFKAWYIDNGRSNLLFWDGHVASVNFADLKRPTNRGPWNDPIWYSR